MKEEFLPGIRDSLIGRAQRNITAYQVAAQKEMERLGRLQSTSALDIRLKVSIGTRWGDYEQGVKIETDSAQAETLEDAVTQAIRQAMIEFCCTNRYRLDNLSMYLANVDIEVEDTSQSASQYLGPRVCWEIFERLGRDQSLYAEVKERKKRSQSK